jgi:amidase
MKREVASGKLDDFRYTTVRDQGLPLVRATLEAIISSNKLDAIVYPTSPRRPALLSTPPGAPAETTQSATNFANLSGFPDLIVPAGFTGDDLPVGISFFGPAFSEPRLLALGYSFEQATRAIRVPVNTPARADDFIGVP